MYPDKKNMRYKFLSACYLVTAAVPLMNEISYLFYYIGLYLPVTDQGN